MGRPFDHVVDPRQPGLLIEMQYGKTHLLHPLKHHAHDVRADCMEHRAFSHPLMHCNASHALPPAVELVQHGVDFWDYKVLEAVRCEYH